MHHALAVGEVECDCALKHNAYNVLDWEEIVRPAEPVERRCTLHVLHDDIAPIVLDTGVDGGDDIRVTQHARCLGFNVEELSPPPRDSVVVRGLRRGDLDGHFLQRERVSTQEHGAHVAVADRPYQLVFTDSRSRLGLGSLCLCVGHAVGGSLPVISGLSWAVARGVSGVSRRLPASLIVGDIARP